MNTPGTSPSAAPRVRDLRAEIERLGDALAEVLGVLLSEIADRSVGPMELASLLDTSQATAGKLLRAISRPNPVAVVQNLPGPVPLRTLMERSLECGARPETVSKAQEEVKTYAELVRHAGDVKSFEAMLSAWLPDERRVFETARRQAVFRALSELDGASCSLQVNTIVLAPGAEDGRLDLVGVTGLFGVRRVRPDAHVALSTLRLPLGPEAKEGASRRPTSLDGTPVDTEPDARRLDEFCMASPAPLVPQQFGDYVQYQLGPTDIGASAEFDLLTAELNRGAGSVRLEGPGGASPFFSTLPQFPTRLLVFDILLHRAIFEPATAELELYVPGGRGLAVPNDPARQSDRRDSTEALTEIGYGLRDLRIGEYPKYPSLVRHVVDTLRFDVADFRAFRLRVQYPLPTQQWMMVFRSPGA